MRAATQDCSNSRARPLCAGMSVGRFVVPSDQRSRQASCSKPPGLGSVGTTLPPHPLSSHDQPLLSAPQSLSSSTSSFQLPTASPDGPRTCSGVLVHVRKSCDAFINPTASCVCHQINRELRHQRHARTTSAGKSTRRHITAPTALAALLASNTCETAVCVCVCATGSSHLRLLLRGNVPFGAGFRNST